MQASSFHPACAWPTSCRPLAGAWQNGGMHAPSSTGLWIALAFIACSSPDEADLFASNETSSTTTGMESEATVTATSDSSAASSDGSGGAASTATAAGGSGSVTSSDSSAVSGGSDASGGGGGSAEGTGGNGSGGGGSGSDGTGGSGTGGESSLGSGGTGALDGASSTGGSSGNEPTVVTLEFEEDDDCVTLACPDSAPYLVGCDVTFSEFNIEYACLAIEGQVIFFKSGENCRGSMVTAGSRVVCSSSPLPHDITAEECVTNKEDLHVVDDRCDCEAADYIDGC